MTTIYRPGDQREKLGPPPWDPLDEQVALWERAHGHDVRTKCYAEFGCVAVQHSAYDDGYDHGYEDGQDNVRIHVDAVVRLLEPDHMTPLAARQIRAVLGQVDRPSRTG